MEYSEARLELVLGFPLEFLKDKSVKLNVDQERFSEHFIKYCKDLTIVDSSVQLQFQNIKISHRKDFLIRVL